MEPGAAVLAEPAGWRSAAGLSRSASRAGRTGTRTWAGRSGKVRAATPPPNGGCEPTPNNSTQHFVPFSSVMLRMRSSVALALVAIHIRLEHFVPFSLHFVPCSLQLLRLRAVVALPLVAMRVGPRLVPTRARR